MIPILLRHIYRLAVTFEIIGPKIPNYEPLRNAVLALQSEVETEVETELELEIDNDVAI